MFEFLCATDCRINADKPDIVIIQNYESTSFFYNEVFDERIWRHLEASFF